MGLVLVDPEDEDLGAKQWSISKFGYAVRARRSGTVYLHIAIAERMFETIPDGMLVDHRNGDRVDCRRANLRLVDRSQHAANRMTVNSTGLRWVEATKGGHYRGEVKWRGKRRRKAGFATAEEAHTWAKHVAEEMQGSDAVHMVRGGQ